MLCLRKRKLLQKLKANSQQLSQKFQIAKKLRLMKIQNPVGNLGPGNVVGIGILKLFRISESGIGKTSALLSSVILFDGWNPRQHAVPQEKETITKAKSQRPTANSLITRIPNRQKTPVDENSKPRW